MRQAISPLLAINILLNNLIINIKQYIKCLKVYISDVIYLPMIHRSPRDAEILVMYPNYGWNTDEEV